MTTKERLDVTIKDLLEAGAHFGHQKKRWNPKMKRFIFEERNGIYIIDLAKTMQQIRNAVEVVKELTAKRKISPPRERHIHKKKSANFIADFSYFFYKVGVCYSAAVFKNANWLF